MAAAKKSSDPNYLEDSYTAHDFTVETERIDGQIRAQKVQQRRLDLSIEKTKTSIKEVQLDDTTEQLKIAQLNHEITQEKTAQTRHKLSQAKIETEAAELQVSITRDNYQALQSEQEFGRELIHARLTGLNIKLAEANAANDNRKAELKKQGVEVGFTSAPKWLK